MSIAPFIPIVTTRPGHYRTQHGVTASNSCKSRAKEGELQRQERYPGEPRPFMHPRFCLLRDASRDCVPLTNIRRPVDHWGTHKVAIDSSTTITRSTHNHSGGAAQHPGLFGPKLLATAFFGCLPPFASCGQRRCRLYWCELGQWVRTPGNNLGDDECEDQS
jgi:hypothetical protein